MTRQKLCEENDALRSLESEDPGATSIRQISSFWSFYNLAHSKHRTLSCTPLPSRSSPPCSKGHGRCPLISARYFDELYEESQEKIKKVIYPVASTHRRMVQRDYRSILYVRETSWRYKDEQRGPGQCNRRVGETSWNDARGSEWPSAKVEWHSIFQPPCARWPVELCEFVTILYWMFSQPIPSDRLYQNSHQ